MNRKIILSVLFFVLFFTWFNSALTYASLNKAPDGYSKSVVASSNTIWVPDNYRTIQEAINNAGEGDTVFVRAGTYHEHVVVNKALSLVGENKHNTIIDGDGTGIVVNLITNNITLSGFTIQNGGLGILFWRSRDNIVTGNNATNNSQYGIYLRESHNNIFTGNAVSNNSYGICIYYSRDNIVTGNNATNNNQYGIYLDGSSYNTLIYNNISTNNDDGILLYHSNNNVLSGNAVSNNSYGIYVGDSNNNVLSGNAVSNNSYGICIYYSRDNIVTGNNATNNNKYGIRLSYSSNNIIFHNNLINNGEPPSSIDSVNSWDNGAEGNYWSDYDGADANWDGIGDTPYPIDENSQDNYPLMAMFLQFNVTTENQSYKITTVCNSTISNFQYHHNKTNAVSFKVNGPEGKGFCRISIPHTLIEPPYTITVDHNPPSYFKIAYTNGTHTWLYFTYDHPEREVTIMHTPYPQQLILSQWAILGLTVIILILLSINIKYYRMFKEQKKIIQVYERELGSLPVNHPGRARARFIKDVIERKEKIEKFKKKYGIKIQPASTLEDLMEKMGVKKEK